MANVYTDAPHNWCEIEPYVITETGMITDEIFRKRRCFFYDTCSFRRHANLKEDARYLLEYIKAQDGAIVITRSILMELASHSGILNQEYVQYIKRVGLFGIEVLVIYEEDIFDVMSVCFSTNAAVNSYLQWAVRMMQGPVSAITDTLKKNRLLFDEIIRGKNPDDPNKYRQFFAAVRKSKESGDNLGEEMLAVCVHILSHIPGEGDGKFSVITDDKGAVGRIDALFKKTAHQFRGNKIGIFSTPRLVQMLFAEKILSDRDAMITMLKAGTNGSVVVLGTLMFDLHINEISITCAELAELIEKPGGINIIY